MSSLPKRKLFLVKREVWADNIAEAVTGKGIVYEVTVADEKYQPEDTDKKIKGFEPAQKTK